MIKNNYKMNKKSVVYSVVLIIFVLFAAITGIIKLYGMTSGVEPIGKRSYEIINMTQYGEKILFILDISSKVSIEKTLFDLGKNADYGRKYSLFDVWKNTTNCIDYDYIKNEFKNIFKNVFTAQVMSNELSKTGINTNNYVLSILNNNPINVVGIYKKNIPIKTNVAGSALGSLGNEKIIKCKAGECVVDIARYYCNVYGRCGNNPLPYVWGGESPYGFEETYKDSLKSNSFFHGVSITRYQPEPHNNELTVPGFDCSGFVWWVYKHAGINGFENRLDASDYEEIGKNEKNNECVCGDKNFDNRCSNECTIDYIKKNTKPGDLIFVYKNGKSQHIAIYSGDGKIIEDVSSGIIERNIPEKYNNEPYNIHSVYRFKYNSEGYDKFVPSDFGCINFDLSNTDDRTLNRCIKYKNYFIISYNTLNDEEKKYIDLPLLFSISIQESGCRPKEDLEKIGSDTACGGIMQVDSLCPYGASSVNKEIQEGVNKLKIVLDNINKEEKEKGVSLNKEDKIKILLLGYNRGSGVAKRSIDYISEGKDVDTAMKLSCYDYFPFTKKGVCGEKGDKERCCNSEGYGAQYPYTIIPKYKNICSKLGGVFSESTEPVYTIRPNFDARIDYNLDLYKKIIDKIKSYSCSNEACINSFVNNLDKAQKKIEWILEFNNNLYSNYNKDEADKDWNKYCSNETNELYKVSDEINNCINNNESLCYCEIRFKGNFNIKKKDNKIYIEYGNENVEIPLNDLCVYKNNNFNEVNNYKIKNDMILYKVGNSVCFSDNSIKSKKECKTDKFTRFCVIDKKRRLMKKQDDNIIYDYVPIKFAVKIGREIPKNVSDIEIKEKKRSQPSAFILWKYDSIPDSFNIYYTSYSSLFHYFDENNIYRIRENIGKGIEKESIDASNIEYLDNINFNPVFKDNPDNEGKVGDFVYKAGINGEEKEVVFKDKLYYIKDSGKYLFVLNGLDDSKKYYITVTAVKSGIEGLFNEYGSVVVYDEISPGKTSITFSELNYPPGLDIKIISPTVNEDGSKLDAEETRLYKIETDLDCDDNTNLNKIYSLSPINTFDINEEKDVIVDKPEKRTCFYAVTTDSLNHPLDFGIDDLKRVLGFAEYKP